MKKNSLSALSRAISGDLLPSEVDNLSFLIEKLGGECPPSQFLREFTENSKDAILRVPGATGKIVWDIDWGRYVSTGDIKLICIDNGIGMSHTEMMRYVKDLSSSSHQQSATGNFGIGAKISALTRNRSGLTYMSWKEGVGSMVQMLYDPVAKYYGLRRWPENGGEFWTPISDEAKPEIIDTHGTVVIFEGNSPEEDTMAAPVGAAMPSRWIMRYLNTRYFQFPEGIEVRAREGRIDDSVGEERRSFLRRIEGQSPWLERHAACSGIVDLTDGKVYWWILRNDADRNSGHFAPGGHTAALFQNELYEMSTGRAAIARLQSFGVIFGTDRVVIYIAPHSGPESGLNANAARTQLKIGDQNLDWSAWAQDFREVLPVQIIDLQHEIGAKSGDRDYKKAIQNRLRQCVDLLRLTRYRRSATGTSLVASRLLQHSDTALSQVVHTPRSVGDRASSLADYVQRFARPGTVRADAETEFDQPTVHWVCETDGTRTTPDMNDRAAKFLADQNTLMINGDFRAISGMIDRWLQAYSHVPGSERVVTDVVREWFEQQLVEIILSARFLKESGCWSEQELAELWSESALTAAVLPRWHIDSVICRSLAHRLGTAKQAA